MPAPAPRQQGVAALLRHRGMRAVAADLNIELIGAGHHRTVMDGELAHRQTWPVVHAKYRIDRKLIEQTLFDHYPRTAIGFLSGLEDEHHRAIEIRFVVCTTCRQVLRRAKQHGGMAVVAAGMHAAIVAGAMRKQVLFAHRQRIHVGAQTNAARAVAAFEDANHTGSRQTAMYRNPLCFKKSGNAVAGALFLKRQFRMRMQVVAQGHQFIAAGKNLR